MLVSEFRKKAILLWQAATAGDVQTAMMLLWELVGAMLAADPVGTFAALTGLRGTTDEGELLAQLKTCCDNPPVEGADEKVGGVILDLMRPILIALLKKWLGI